MANDEDDRRVRFVTYAITGEWEPKVGDRVRLIGGVSRGLHKTYGITPGSKGTITKLLERTDFDVSVVMDDPEERSTAVRLERSFGSLQFRKRKDGHWNCYLSELEFIG